MLFDRTRNNADVSDRWTATRLGYQEVPQKDASVNPGTSMRRLLRKISSQPEMAMFKLRTEWVYV